MVKGLLQRLHSVIRRSTGNTAVQLFMLRHCISIPSYLYLNPPAHHGGTSRPVCHSDQAANPVASKQPESDDMNGTSWRESSLFKSAHSSYPDRNSASIVSNEVIIVQSHAIVWSLMYRPEAGSRFRFQGKLCPVPRFQRCQTCQFLVPALGHPLANMSHAGSSKFLTKCMITL